MDAKVGKKRVVGSPDRAKLTNKENQLLNAFDSVSKDLCADPIYMAKQQLEEAN